MENDGKFVFWSIIGCIEVLKGDWQLVGLEGYDEDGSYYTASMETFISDPVIIEENIIDVEKFVKYELPHNVRNCYCIEDIVKCVENWGLCKVEKEHIERFLNDIKGK